MTRLKKHTDERIVSKDEIELAIKKGHYLSENLIRIDQNIEIDKREYECDIYDLYAHDILYKTELLQSFLSKYAWKIRKTIKIYVRKGSLSKFANKSDAIKDFNRFLIERRIKSLISGLNQQKDKWIVLRKIETVDSGQYIFCTLVKNRVCWLKCFWRKENLYWKYQINMHIENEGAEFPNSSVADGEVIRLYETLFWGIYKATSTKEEYIRRLEEYTCKKESGKKNDNREMFNEVDIRRREKVELVVKNNLFGCGHREHRIEDIVAVIETFSEHNGVRIHNVSAGYCKVCEMFMILNEKYEEIRECGVPTCRVIDIEQFYEGDNKFVDLKIESILKKRGYNVQAKENLSDDQRQDMLADMIDEKRISGVQITSYLSRFIASKKGLDNYEEAISKWKADIQFVNNYDIDNKKRYYVKSIYRRKYLKG